MCSLSVNEHLIGHYFNLEKKIVAEITEESCGSSYITTMNSFWYGSNLFDITLQSCIVI